jgi:hypothetical protein
MLKLSVSKHDSKHDMQNTIVAWQLLYQAEIPRRTFEGLCMGHYMSCGVIKLVSAEAELMSACSLVLYSVSLCYCTQFSRLSCLAQR